MKIVKFNQEKKYIDDFINLAKRLYSKKNDMEDSKTMYSFLTNKHPLSHYFKLNKFLVYDEDIVVGRFIITEYPDDKNTCYIGFFECINDSRVSKYLFDEAYKYAKKKKYKKIVGPVDASFWNKYRLKINMFDRLPYTGEPYNLDYYYKMFLDNKYKVIEHYTSNSLSKLDESFYDKKFTEHFAEFKKLGYEIVKPKRKEFDKCIEEIYYLIMDSYSSFPIFKRLEKDDFINIFSSYKPIVNMNMIRMVYYKEKAVGFCISVPNYNNMVYHLNLINIIKIQWNRKHPKEYVIPYMGIDLNHKGLGKAMAYTISEELKKNNLPAISALIRDGKVTLKYGEEKIVNQYEYVLLERDIK